MSEATKNASDFMEIVEAVKRIQEHKRRHALTRTAADRAREAIRRKRQFNIKTKFVAEVLAKLD